RRAGCGIAHGERPRILVGLDAASEPTGDRASQLDIAQRHAIGLAVDSRLDLEGEAGALAGGLGEPAEFLALAPRQLCAARIEGDLRHVDVLATAAEQRAQRTERRGDDLGDEAEQGLADQAAEAEFGILERPRHGQAEVDAALAVLEDRNGQVERQVRRVFRLELLAKRELIHDDPVVALQLLVLDPVLEIERQFARGDAPPGEGRRIRRQLGHLDIANSTFASVCSPGAKRLISPPTFAEPYSSTLPSSAIV